MEKKIIVGADLQKHIRKGMADLANIVAVTLGPGGQPILCERLGEALNGTRLKPKITKDGVSVANECLSSCPETDVVIQTVKAICQKTNIDVGDGTTTAIVLGSAILEASLAYLEKHPEVRPHHIKQSMDALLPDILNYLDEMAWPIETSEAVAQVATISANGDSEVGDIIAKAFKEVGVEGVVTIDEGGAKRLDLEVVEGYRFMRGAQARDAFFNNKTMSAFEGEDVVFLIYDGTLRSYQELIPFLNLLAKLDEKQELTEPLPQIVVIANDFTRDVIQWLLIQKTEKGISFCPVLGPNTSHVRTQYYDDLAVFTGGYRFGNGNRSLSTITLEDIGEAEKVEVDLHKTTIFGGGGVESDILVRVEVLKASREKVDSPYDIQGINDRIAALTGGIAKILVGGTTEVELKELYDRVEDAVNAARVAIKEGVLPGGGVALLKVAHYYKLGGFEKALGGIILKAALQVPCTQILKNGGMAAPDIKKIVGELLAEDLAPNTVFNAAEATFVDAAESGIVDPVLVTKSALRNALSIAGLLLTVGGAIVYTEKGATLNG